MNPKILIFALLGLIQSIAYAEHPCKMKFISMSKSYAAPGESFEMHGRWGEYLETKIPSINMGNPNNLQVLSWSDTTVKVRIPAGLRSGVYRVGVYCIHDGQTSSPGFKDFEVTEGFSMPSESMAAPTILPKTIGGSAMSLRDKAKALWKQNRREESRQAYTEAIAAYREAKDSAGEASCLASRGSVSDVLGDAKSADQDIMESAVLYRKLLEQAKRDMKTAELNKLEIEYANLLYSLARSSLRAKDYSEVERIHKERLDIYARRGDIGGQAVCFNGLGEVNEILGRHAEAMEFFDKCERFYRQSKNPHGVKACAAAASALRTRKGVPERQVKEGVRPRPIEPEPAPTASLPPVAPVPADTPAAATDQNRQGLAALRGALSSYRWREGHEAETLSDLTKEGKDLETIPLLEIPHHRPGRNFRLYPFYNDAPNKAAGLLDTGGWGYDPQSGKVFIDCLHKPAQGEPYHSW